MAKVVTLGEIMLRLSPEGNDRFIQTDSFRIIPGGGEANVAVSLANYGHEAYFVSKLPSHEIGQIAVNALRRYGVKTDFIAVAVSASVCTTLRPVLPCVRRRLSTTVRTVPSLRLTLQTSTSIRLWKVFLVPLVWHHSRHLRQGRRAHRLACEAAKRHGVTVSVDLNFRKKLWTSEKAISIMRPLMKYVDVCIGNEEDAALCLGFKPDADVEHGNTDAAGYYNIFKGMMKEFDFKYVVSTLRESYSATYNGWKALIYNGKDFYESKHYDINSDHRPCRWW